MYSSPADVRNALTPGADDADLTTAASFEDAQIEDAIKEADSVIDTFVWSLFGIPQDADNPDVSIYPVRAWSRDIAAYLATLTYRKSKDLTEEDPIRLRFLWVMGILQKISDGELIPKLPQPPTPPDGYGPQGAFVYNQNPFRLFTPADVFCPPGRGWSYVQQHRYGDFAWSAYLSGSGFNQVLVLFDGQPIPAGTPSGTLIVFIPEGS